jgi:hypothetical protein
LARRGLTGQGRFEKPILCRSADDYARPDRRTVIAVCESIIRHRRKDITRVSPSGRGLRLSLISRLIGPLIRFFAHLILILRNLNRLVPETPANAILQAYLQILEREGNDQLVAMYAACLREGSGEESYARFLYGVLILIGSVCRGFG